jgi:hypothetical protein
LIVSKFGDTSSADEFLDAALTWFGDPDPRLGTVWEKGERLAKLVGHRRTLLVLDGLEPLQNPPGAQEGRLREPSLQALLRELAAFNMGLCVITTRMPVADLSDHEGSSALRRDLEHLSSHAGAQLLRALGVKGDEAELRSASDEFSGHCLAPERKTRTMRKKLCTLGLGRCPSSKIVEDAAPQGGSASDLKADVQIEATQVSFFD